MAELLYVYVVLSVLMVVDTHRDISGLYCRDPDTGKLYEVNSTWRSETFCGNYTCRLSKKNITETEYTPITHINITGIKFDGDSQNETLALQEDKNNSDQNPSSVVANADSTTILDMIVSPSEVNSVKKKITNEVKPINKKMSYIDKNKTENESIDEKDRYLTDSEINLITDILHTVKKSDLEAIVDVYNLAQEIYNEMESSTEKSKLTSSQTNNMNINKIFNKDTSEVTLSQLQNSYKDMKTEGTSASPTSQFYAYPSTYFEGLYKNNNGKLPYYYPMSDFQRMSSYFYTKPPKQASKNKPCKQKSTPATTSRYTRYSTWPTKANYEKHALMMPYPFSNVRRYNMSDYTSYYYNYYPWAQLDIYNKNRNYMPNYLNALFAQAPSKVTDKSKEIKNNVVKNKNIEKISPVKKAEIKKDTKKMPKWQTEPLSAQVIEEVKANVMDTNKILNLFPRKSIQLERVGKVIKLDELERSKRNVNDVIDKPDYEVQLDKILCETGTEPGYFSYGNLTAPYPECCPRKIGI